MRHILPSLMGSWVLSRSIDNGCAMTGTATFARHGDRQCQYREQGRLTLTDGKIIDAERRYIFEAQEGGFTVFFAEQPVQLFHRVVLKKVGPMLVGAASHLCGDDRYASRYEFHADGSFVIAHDVSGPRKAYAMETRYVRASI